MRLFILSRIRLADLAGRPDAPAAGDVVAYFREAQDLDGAATRHLTDAGVVIEWAEREIGPDEPPAIERAVLDACFGWFRENGVDPTVIDDPSLEGLSLGRVLAAQFYVHFNLFYLMRAGLILDRLIGRHEAARAVVTDLRDGTFIYCDHPEWPESMPWRSMLESLATRRGWTVGDLPVSDGVTSVFRAPAIPDPIAAWMEMLRRPSLPPRRDDGPPWVFVFSTHGVARVAEVMARSGRVRVAADRPGLAGVRFVAPRRIPAIPGRKLRRAARRLRRAADAAGVAWRDGSPFRYGDVDIGPMVARSLRWACRHQLPVILLRIAQFQRLVGRGRMEAVVTCATYHEQTLAAAAWGSAATGGRGRGRAYFVEHSILTQPCGFYSGPYADTGLVYLAESEAHLPAYGLGLPDGAKPGDRRIVASVTLPEMVAMRGLRPEPPSRRVLCIGYNSYSPHAMDRSPFYDRYLVALAEVARALRDDGIVLHYRRHPAERPDYAESILADIPGGESIGFDAVPSFREALPGYDVVVSSASTCYYQALFAGWPTIFFEPSDMPSRWIGLAAEPESGRPFAHSADALLHLIRDAYDPAGPTAAFADFHRRPESERYFGHGAEHADRAVAEVVSADLRGPDVFGADDESASPA